MHGGEIYNTTSVDIYISCFLYTFSMYKNEINQNWEEMSGMVYNKSVTAYCLVNRCVVAISLKSVIIFPLRLLPSPRIIIIMLKLRFQL